MWHRIIKPGIFSFSDLRKLNLTLSLSFSLSVSHSFQASLSHFQLKYENRGEAPTVNKNLQTVFCHWIWWITKFGTLNLGVKSEFLRLNWKTRSKICSTKDLTSWIRVNSLARPRPPAVVSSQSERHRPVQQLHEGVDVSLRRVSRRGCRVKRGIDLSAERGGGGRGAELFNTDVIAQLLQWVTTTTISDI